MLVWCLIGSPLVGALVLWLRRRAVPRWRWPRCVDCRQLTAPAEMRGERCRYCEGRQPRCMDCRQLTAPAEMRDHRCPACLTARLRRRAVPRCPRRQVSRACLDAHCRVARVVDIMARSGPTVQLVPPSRICGDCGATLPPRHPWAACTACMGVRVTAAYLARTTRRTVAVSEDELRRIWDRVAW